MKRIIFTTLLVIALALTVNVSAVINITQTQAMSNDFLNPSVHNITGEVGKKVEIYVQKVSGLITSDVTKNAKIVSDAPNVLRVENNTLTLLKPGKGHITITANNLEVKVPYAVEESKHIKILGDELIVGVKDSAGENLVNQMFMINDKSVRIKTDDKGLLRINTNKLPKTFSIYIMNSVGGKWKAYKLAGVEVKDGNAYFTTFSAQFKDLSLIVNTTKDNLANTQQQNVTPSITLPFNLQTAPSDIVSPNND